ncbi:CAP domain-containing protein [Streptomyces erythrochromogenes]|uniref:CAP domain-containing protein n=1 Tax=Streptomyces erythrochromogenes TaxID=285574 RepID=UPI0038112D95
MAFGSGRIRRGCTAVCASSLLVLGGAIGAGAAAAAEPASVTVGARAGVPLQVDPNELLKLENDARAKAGCNTPLAIDPKVQAAAQKLADDNVGVSHTGSDGSSVQDRLQAAGATYTASAENVSQGTDAAQGHFDRWMNSTGVHKANILNCSYSKTGIAVNGDRVVQVFTN